MKISIEYIYDHEIYTLAILIIYLFLAIITANYNYLLINSFLIISIFIISNKILINKANNVRKLYLLPLIYFIYSQMQLYVKTINTKLYDESIYKIDNLIFGNYFNLFQNISNPFLTEYLQISYSLFYLLPVIFIVELIIRKNSQQFKRYAGVIVFTFYISYLLYLLFPAIGPRFFIFDFNELSKELPGILLTEYLREFVNYGGGIINPSLNPADQVNRDCMPSGHTMITLMNIYYVFKYNSKLKYVQLILGSSLIFATVYLRYHYLLDIIVGALCFMIILIIEPIIYKLLKLYRQRKNG